MQMTGNGIHSGRQSSKGTHLHFPVDVPVAVLVESLAEADYFRFVA